MAQKINPIVFRKNSRGLYFLNNKSSVLHDLFAVYSLKNYYQLQSFLENFFSFFNLSLDSLLVMETNNSIFFVSLRYRSQILKQQNQDGKLLKQTITKALLRLIPAKSLYLRLLNNRKIFGLKLRKKKLTRVLRRVRLFCCDPFNLIKTLRYSFFNSNFFAYIITKELKLVKKKHNRFLTLCGKIARLSIRHKNIKSNLKGIKICIKGKFNGRLRAKTKMLQVGTLSLQKMLSVVDYCSLKSTTSDGTFGVKVWFHY
jgi:hypothetical protein